MNLKLLIPCIFSAAVLLFVSCKITNSGNEEKNSSGELTVATQAIANEMEKVLTEKMMEIWYPKSIDSLHGGFLTRFDYQWKQLEEQPKFIVIEARHVWAAAQMAEMYPGNNLYLDVSEHGYKFLRDVMWDSIYGGYITMTTRDGTPLPERRYKNNKIAYGNAFAIYGLAAYFNVSGDSSALNLAIKSFQWLDEHAYDEKYGGYFQFLKPDGTAFTSGFNGTPPKDQNSSIHILEAFAELYKVWKNEHLKQRISELIVLIRDTITTEKGYMNLYFRRDWSPVLYTDKEFVSTENPHAFDYISFGHDIETAFLLLEASEVIGLKDDTVTHKIAKKMTDHTIKNGWDPETGATYEAGYYFDGEDEITILDSHTQWWEATETFHTLLIMSKLYPDDSMNYYEKFTKSWDYCKKYLIDYENGGWYRLGINEVPQMKYADKADIWKGNYHNTRSLKNCIYMLRGLNLNEH